MDAALKAAPLSVERTDGAGAHHVRLRGVINEAFDGARLGELAPVAVLDLAGVTQITSFGVRRWCELMQSVAPTTRMYLLSCPPCVVDQINMVLNFCGRAEVLTARVVYYCHACDREQESVVDLLREGAQIRAGALPRPTCAQCQAPLELDGDSLRFAPRYGAQQLDPAAAQLLRKLGVYDAARATRPLDVSKLVEGSVTLFRLQGGFDARVRGARLASDLDGTAALFLGDASVAPDGVAPFRDFFSALAKQCSEVVLVDLPSSIAELHLYGEVDLSRAIIYSLRLPAYCPSCEQLASFTVSADALMTGAPMADVCQRCGGKLQKVDGMIAVERLLPQLRATPSAIAEIVERASELFSVAQVEERVSADTRGGGARTKLGGYRIIRPLSEGGMAEVFLAARESLGGFEKPVALKLFRRTLLETSSVSLGMFLHEAKICARLNHPNIVQIFDVGEVGGDLYMAMEYVDGRDAATVLSEHQGALPAPLVTQIGLSVLGALDYAHHAADLDGKPLSIVHRDVSANNVLIGFDGWIKLIDFGIALAGAEALRTQSTVAGNVCYMSPEQCAGKPLDGRSDLFSLGVVLYELLAGASLFRRDTVHQTLGAMLTLEVPRIAGVPDRLMDVVMRALERDPDRRFQSARELAAALREAAADIGGPMPIQGVSSFVRELFQRDASARRAASSDGFAETVPQQTPTPLPKRAPEPPAATVDADREPAPAPVASQPVAAAPYRPAPPPQIAPPPPERNVWRWVIMAVSLLVAVGLLGWALGDLLK